MKACSYAASILDPLTLQYIFCSGSAQPFIPSGVESFGEHLCTLYTRASAIVPQYYRGMPLWVTASDQEREHRRFQPSYLHLWSLHAFSSAEKP